MRVKVALLLVVLPGFAGSGVAQSEVTPAPAIRTVLRADVSRAPAGVPIALEVRFTNTTAERMYFLRRRVEPSLQQFVATEEGAYVEVERLGNDREVVQHHCPVVSPPELRESDFMEIDGGRHLVSSVFPLDPGQTRVVRLDNIAACYDLFAAGTYRLRVAVPAFFSQSQVVERFNAYFVTAETESKVWQTRKQKTTEPVLISITAHPATPSFREAREAITRGQGRNALRILGAIRAKATSDEIRAAALFWEAMVPEEHSQYATAREAYERVSRAFPRTAAGRIAGHRAEAFRDRRDLQ